MWIWTVALICGLAPIGVRSLAIAAGEVPAGASPENPARDFVLRLKDGQTRFRQGEIITVELGYGADPQAPVKGFPDHPDQPGLAVDRFLLSPRSGVMDPLRDFLATVGAWAGRAPRRVPFVKAGGPWTAADINEWFRFDNPGRYTLSVLAHTVRSRFEALGNRPATAKTLTSNSVDFEIVPADPAWQAATLNKALGRLDAEFGAPDQGCRILRFLATPQAVEKMVEHYADQGVCESEYRYGLFAYPDREYAVRRMEDGILDPSTAVSAGYLDTLARLSAYVDHAEFLPSKDEEHLGTTDWGIGGSTVALAESIRAEQNRYVRELLGALGDKLVKPRALCLKAIFDSPFLGQPTLLESGDPATIAQLRRQIAALFTELPIFEQSMLLFTRWGNIASPAMIPVLKQIYENPPEGSNEQFIACVLDDLYRLDPAEGRALILTEMKRLRPRLDLRFVRLLPDKEIPELDDPLLRNLQAGNGDEDTILQLIGRYATPSIFPQVMAIAGPRVERLPCQAQAAFLIYAARSDPLQGAAMLDRLLKQPKGCALMTLSEVASRQMTPEIERLVIERLNDSDPQTAAGAAGILGRYGSAEAEPSLWDRLEKWHADWAGRASELPDGSGIALRNGLETALESALIDALGAGQAWFAGPDDLARLAGLCVSSGGCRRVQEITAQAAATPNVNVYGSPDGRRGSVAQYQVDSIGSLKRKLAQFPEGTQFTWLFSGDQRDGASVLADLRAFLKSHGMTIR